MEPRSVTNSVKIGGSATGPIIQSGGAVRVTGGISVNATGKEDLLTAVESLRALLKEHGDQVPMRAVTDTVLGQIAAEVREPGPNTPSVVGELWGELGPRLAELSDSLAGLKPRLATISEGVGRL